MKTILLFWLCALNAFGIELLWDANPETNVAYKVYMGKLSRSYQTNFTTTNTSLTIANTNLFPSTNYFALTAFYLDDPSTESEFSDEVSYTVPRVPPRRPVNLRIRATNGVAQIRLLQSTNLTQNYWRETGVAFVELAAGTGAVFFEAVAPAAPKVFLSAPNPKSGKLIPRQPPRIIPPLPPMPPK